MSLQSLIYNEITDALEQSYDIQPVDIDDKDMNTLRATTKHMSIAFSKCNYKCAHPYDISISKNNKHISLKGTLTQTNLRSLYRAAKNRYSTYFKESTRTQREAYRFLLDCKANEK